MKSLAYVLLAISIGLVACTQNSPEGKQVEAQAAETIEAVSAEADTLTVDVSQSTILWKATEPGEEGHNGSISLQSGQLYVLDSTLVGGQFVIDMNQIEVLDLTGGRKAKLEKNLKGETFFEAETFPTASFTIGDVTPATDSMSNYTLTGNLAMKDSVKSISIPVMITMEGGALQAKTPAFTIDRTEWGIVHRSSIIGTVANKLIDDQVGMQISLVAK